MMKQGLEEKGVVIDPQEISRDIFLERYALPGEATPEDVQRRVAAALAAVERDAGYWQEQFFLAQQKGLIPGGRINCAAGGERGGALLNCFVQPVEDSIDGIYHALHAAAETMRRGGGVGYNFSTLRPAGARVRSTGTLASGPLSFMQLFDCSGAVIESAGARRGAQMGVLDCDHPDIEAFVQAKSAGGLRNFNLSVAVSDRFMQAVVDDDEWTLLHAAEPDRSFHPQAERRPDGRWCYRTVPARALWAQIIQSAYEYAEPGVLFIDKINRDNNLEYCERIAATNPCGEQPLPPYGCCDLASINLAALVLEPFLPAARFDFASLGYLARTGVRLLDNVYDVTAWSLPQQGQEARQKRRIGLGFLGLGDALVMLGLRYDSEPARQFAARVAQTLRNEAYLASVSLAQEKGAFPLFSADQLLSGEHSACRLPESIKAQIRQHGLRNSHLTCIAPTGTISLAFADNASNGIEPAYAWHYRRNKRMPDGRVREYAIEDHAYRLFCRQGGAAEALPRAFVAAHELAARDHLRMVAAVQPYIDAAISKTVNIPADYPFAEFETLYFEAWQSGLKGITVFRPRAQGDVVLFQ